MFRTNTVTPRTYAGSKRAAGGGGPSGPKSKRGGKASSVMSKAKGVKAVKQTPTSIIKTVVRSLAEKKSVNTDPADYVWNGNNNTMAAAVDLTAALASIGQGFTEGTRVGNKIRLARYTLKISATFLSAVSGAVDQGIMQIFVGRLKQNPAKLPDAADLARIYNDGSGTASSDGTMLATLRDINTDYFQIVAYKRFKMGLSAGNSNNDFPSCVEFVMNDLLKGDVQYTDALTPSNKFLFMWAQFTTLDDVNSNFTLGGPKLRYFISCQYTDL